MTRPKVPPSSGAATDWRWAALTWVVTAVIAGPFFLPGWLPLTDLPEHAASMSSIGHWTNPAYRVPEHFFVGWTTSQYLLVHLVGGVLTMLIGDAELACRIILVGLAIGWVQGMRSLLRAVHADERLAVMGALLFWNRSLVVGFLPYVASLPLLFVSLAAYIRTGEAPTRRPRARWLGLAASGVAVFYAHASAFTLLSAIAGAIAVHRGLARARGPARAPARGRAIDLIVSVVLDLSWLAPAVVLAGIWVARGRFGMHGSSIHESGEIGTMNPFRAVKLIALYAHDTWTSHVDDWIGISFWTIFVVLLVVGELRRRRDGERAAVSGSLIPVAVAFVVYLITPFRVGTGLLLNVRMAPVLGLFALLGLRPVRGRVGSGAVAVAALLSVVQCVDNVREMTRLQTDIVGLPDLLATMPKGSRLMTLNFSGYDPGAAHFTPWLHVGSYHRVFGGGVAEFSFSELPHWSVQYRPENAPPKQPQISWGMKPCLFRNASDGAYFDFVLTRGRLNPFEHDPPGPRWTVRGRTAKYTLYQKDGARPPIPPGPTPDEGPCPVVDRTQSIGSTDDLGRSGGTAAAP